MVQTRWYFVLMSRVTPQGAGWSQNKRLPARGGFPHFRNAPLQGCWVLTGMSWVLEITPNPHRVSIQEPKLITRTVKNKNTRFWYIIVVIKNSNIGYYIELWFSKKNEKMIMSTWNHRFFAGSFTKPINFFEVFEIPGTNSSLILIFSNTQWFFGSETFSKYLELTVLYSVFFEIPGTGGYYKKKIPAPPHWCLRI